MTTRPNLPQSLRERIEAAKAKLGSTEQQKKEIIEQLLAPKPVVQKAAAPLPISRPQLKTCKGQSCELPNKLFVPAKPGYDYCTGCSVKREEAKRAAKLEEQMLFEEVRALERQAKEAEQLLADFKAGNGKALLCSSEGCNTIERPGAGYQPHWSFKCFKCREVRRTQRQAGPVRQMAQPAHSWSAPVVAFEDTATRNKKRRKAEAEALMVAGGALPEGVTVHSQLDRTVVLKFEAEGEEVFYHTLTLPISPEQKRKQDEAAKKRRLENRQRIDDAPKKKGK